ncbi:hypothetical protein HanRHA438_Chr07g0307161 [Helianthus annuus]|uniref:Uncharacterized protein n=1 Tax=Helianthus annuus TaxID=4232 RepID=A0A9K3NGB7_HELAN|nr:hypothetical protein HanXRQr2_Chr07g0296841 [Helianthus annuus]KAJ0550331.1 hypothetical protein HanHA300_Chr07g0244201 [Helianthus annuus]KAJ0557024.1 hypothetical protein HanIR_Chr07g0320451 [Helianthus annuus]KAJ0563285.1 hypothetical protein HanHA89_Chr07g0261381 [Helianthus annuus]KAJ0728630.1 hypothetical protein HanLR1_Chr07g0243811 [Helianthus annuus]
MLNLTFSLHLNLPDSLSLFYLLFICLSPHFQKPEISHNSPSSSSSISKSNSHRSSSISKSFVSLDYVQKTHTQTSINCFTPSPKLSQQSPMFLLR